MRGIYIHRFFRLWSLVLIFLMSIFIIFIGALQLRTALGCLEQEIESNDQKPIAHKLMKLFWYPDEYYERKKIITPVSIK